MGYTGNPGTGGVTANNAMLQASEAVYLYCFTQQGLPVLPGPAVDENRPVTIFEHRGLTAVISSVCLNDYIGETGETHLQDIAWVGPRACRHAAVVEQVMVRGPVFPLPFGTLFSSLAALEQEITQRSAEVASTLRHLSDCQEWAVEGTLERKLALDALFADGLQSGRIRLPDARGRRHLEEQRLRRELALDLDAWTRQQLELLQTEITPLARDFRCRRLLNGRILHWAFLLPVTQVEAFRRQVDESACRLQDYGLTVRLSGPWPPYSFCGGSQ